MESWEPPLDPFVVNEIHWEEGEGAEFPAHERILCGDEERDDDCLLFEKQFLRLVVDRLPLFGIGLGRSPGDQFVKPPVFLTGVIVRRVGREEVHEIVGIGEVGPPAEAKEGGRIIT